MLLENLLHIQVHFLKCLPVLPRIPKRHPIWEARVVYSFCGELINRGLKELYSLANVGVFKQKSLRDLQERARPDHWRPPPQRPSRRRSGMRFAGDVVRSLVVKAARAPPRQNSLFGGSIFWIWPLKLQL